MRFDEGWIRRVEVLMVVLVVVVIVVAWLVSRL